MPSHFLCSPLIREWSQRKTQIEKNLKHWLVFANVRRSTDTYHQQIQEKRRRGKQNKEQMDFFTVK